MNLEPPSLTDAPYDNNRLTSTLNQFPQMQRNANCSPLVRSNLVKSFDISLAPSTLQNEGNFMNNRPYNKPVHNRLGNRNQYQKIHNNSGNANDTSYNNGHFNRKRHSDTASTDSLSPKKKWQNKRMPFYQNTNNYQHNSVQNRINRIRNNTQTGQIMHDNMNQGNSSNLYESQEFDATDITVEVVNNLINKVDDTQDPPKFKMVLDPKCQAAIRVIQNKRKDKQVIFPFPVTPNVTEISLHQRFTML